MRNSSNRSTDLTLLRRAQKRAMVVTVDYYKEKSKPIKISNCYMHTDFIKSPLLPSSIRNEVDRTYRLDVSASEVVLR